MTDDVPAVGTLRLLGGPKSGQHAARDEDVIDNEGLWSEGAHCITIMPVTDLMSLCHAVHVVCRIYHKPREFNEFSSEELSDNPDSYEGLSDSGGGDLVSHIHGRGLSQILIITVYHTHSSRPGGLTLQYTGKEKRS